MLNNILNLDACKTSAVQWHDSRTTGLVPELNRAPKLSRKVTSRAAKTQENIDVN